MEIYPTANSTLYERSSSLATAPIQEPVTIPEFREFARIPDDGNTAQDSDRFLERIIKTARKGCEKYTNRAFIKQEWILAMDRFPNKKLLKTMNWNVIELPYAPLISVDSVRIYSDSSTYDSVDTDHYTVDVLSEPGMIHFTTVPTAPLLKLRGIRIHYQAGYGTEEADVPSDIKDAIMIWVNRIYRKRTMGANLPKAKTSTASAFGIGPDEQILLDPYIVRTQY